MRAIVLVSESSIGLAHKISQAIDAVIYSQKELDGCIVIKSYTQFIKENWNSLEQIVFIGAMGICVRSIAPCVKDKYKDPAVVCVDSTGKFVIPVLSGHIGGANDLARQIAQTVDGQAVVTTQSDNTGLWALDTLATKYNWHTDISRARMNSSIALFVEKHPTALLLEVRDAGADYLESTLPEHVKVFSNYNDIDFSQFELLITVGPHVYDAPVPVLGYYPQVLHIGVGCRRQCKPDGIGQFIEDSLKQAALSPLAIASIGTIQLKKDEPLLADLQSRWSSAVLNIWSKSDLEGVEVPNPSEKAFEVTGVYGVAEGAALRSSGDGILLIEKQKGQLSEGNDFTFAVAQDGSTLRSGFIEIVGAGPGDPELISVRGKRMLEQADLVLYAGSLVPKELTYYAKPGSTVRSSADMDLEEQFALMKEFYDKGLFVVRLHTGDPCIYGAIQEQMAFFDRYGMRYHITPGISSFQAAAAALRSQFTIPEKVQSIILTRGEGRTPMPEKEQLHKLAQSQSTMCIYLSAAIVEQVQEELLQAYPPETPVAACYKLTWKEERIYRGQLKDLARIVRENNLTLTTLLVVGDAIDNRQGLSRLYAHEFKHLFRK